LKKRYIFLNNIENNIIRKIAIIKAIIQKLHIK